MIRRRKMVRAFTGEPLALGTAERLLRAANRAPSAGFSQGYSFLVLEGKEQAAPLWQLLCEQTESEGTTQDDGPDQVAALSTAPLVIVPAPTAHSGCSGLRSTHHRSSTPSRGGSGFSRTTGSSCAPGSARAARLSISRSMAWNSPMAIAGCPASTPGPGS